MDKVIRIGTAGWSIPRQVAEHFPGEGSHLQRYARLMPAVEINSSFHRPHRPATYERWAASAPRGFRFAAKLPRVITHEARLRDTAEPLARFLGEVSMLDEALGPLLIQLPPSLQHDEALVEDFFSSLRQCFAGAVACEPRHPNWFTDEVDEQLARFHVARVAADPAIVPRAAEPGGWRGLTYRRWHGSPEIYRSAYPAIALDRLAAGIRADGREGRECWCIFDNTTLGEATRNAIDLLERLN